MYEKLPLRTITLHNFLRNIYSYFQDIPNVNIYTNKLKAEGKQKYHRNKVNKQRLQNISICIIKKRKLAVKVLTREIKWCLGNNRSRSHFNPKYVSDIQYTVQIGSHESIDIVIYDRYKRGVFKFCKQVKKYFLFILYIDVR